MAALTALQRLIASPKTAKFVETLRHADLPVNWADDPEIVSMAGDAYRELGTGSPFFRAYERAVGSADNPGGVMDSVYHGSRNKFDTFDIAAGRQLDDVRDAVRTPIFFSPSREFADVFANAPGPGEAQIYEGWVRPKKTFDYENQEQLKDVLNNVKAGSFEDKIFLRNTIPSGAWKVIEGPEVQTALKNLGYDSYRTAEGGKKNIAIFDPRQFKSVENRGTFNPADPNIYRGLIPMLAGGGALAAMAPGSAQAAEATPAETAPRIGGMLGYAARGNPVQAELAAAAQNQDWGKTVTWDDVRHGLSFGSRAVLEGLGGLAEMGPNAIANAAISPFTDFRFGNPGVAAADAMDLDRPQTEAERSMYGLESGAAEAVPFVAGGGALAKGGAGAAKQFGKFLADNPRAQAILGGMLGMMMGGGE